MKKLILSGLLLFGVYSHIESMRLESTQLELENDSIYTNLLRHLIKNNHYESLKYLIKKDKFESDITKFLTINNKILDDYFKPIKSPIKVVPKAISECPICLEPVLSTQECYLFPCNDTRHAMHLSCYSEQHSDLFERCLICRAEKKS